MNRREILKSIAASVLACFAPFEVFGPWKAKKAKPRISDEQWEKLLMARDEWDFKYHAPFGRTTHVRVDMAVSNRSDQCNLTVSNRYGQVLWTGTVPPGRTATYEPGSGWKLV